MTKTPSAAQWAAFDAELDHWYPRHFVGIRRSLAHEGARILLARVAAGEVFEPKAAPREAVIYHAALAHLCDPFAAFIFRYRGGAACPELIRLKNRIDKKAPERRRANEMLRAVACFNRWCTRSEKQESHG